MMKLPGLSSNTLELKTDSTRTRHVGEGLLGTGIASVPSLAVLEANGMGNVAPPLVESLILTFPVTLLDDHATVWAVPTVHVAPAAGEETAIDDPDGLWMHGINPEYKICEALEDVVIGCGCPAIASSLLLAADEVPPNALTASQRSRNCASACLTGSDRSSDSTNNGTSLRANVFDLFIVDLLVDCIGSISYGRPVS